MNTTTPLWGTHGPVSLAGRSRHGRYQLFAFRVRRRSGRLNHAPVRPRRVCVYAPSVDAALAGTGAGKDEAADLVPVRFIDYRHIMGSPRREEIADFYETLGHALATGAGMVAALAMAARMSRSARMRGLIGTLHEKIVHGEELHMAMRGFPEVFTPMQLAMVEASAATGLDKAGLLLVTLAQRLQKDGRIWRKFIGAISYPVSLLILTLIGAVVLEIWALPPMVELFRSLGGRLPPITQRFYAVAQFLRVNAKAIIPFLVVGSALAFTVGPRLLRSRAAQRLSVRLVLIGPIVQAMALVRALGTFILLKQSGANVRDQFAMAAAAAGNCVVGDFFESCYGRIALGESVEEAFTAERHRLGDDGVRMAGKMEVGMAGADVTVLLGRMMDELNDRADTRLNLLPNALRWPLMILCCFLIGTVALAIVLPYPNLIADIAHQQVDAGRP
jgi:type II secretory pathway component PulF